MKFTKIISLALAMAMLLCLASCFGGSKVDGTYYAYDEGKTDKEIYIKLNGSNWSDNDSLSGSFEIDGTKISFYITIEGEKELLAEGKIEDGKITLGNGNDAVFYLDGKAPSDEEDGGNDGEGEGELEFTLLSDDTYALTGFGTFSGTRLEIPAEYNGKAVTAIAGTWGVNNTIKEIIIPDSVTAIGMRNNGVSGMFEGFTALEHIDFGDGIKTIPQKVCNRVKTLKTVVIGSSVTFIDKEAFDNTGLVTLTIPEGVTTIAFSAFHQCEKLESVYLPASLSSIGASAFQTCSVLKTVHYAGTEDEFFNISKDKTSFQRCHEELQFVYGE